MTDGEYPEHKRMEKIQPKSQTIGEFLIWLRENRIFLCRYGGGELLLPICDTIEDLLADYFDIDLTKIEMEKKAMLEYTRQLNKEGQQK